LRAISLARERAVELLPKKRFRMRKNKYSAKRRKPV